MIIDWTQGHYVDFLEYVGLSHFKQQQAVVSTTVTPSSRTVVIAAEDRTITIAAETRIVTIEE